jgi:betaine lipid synthase
VRRLCEAKTVEEQERIWKKHLRPVLLNKIMLKGFLGNPCVTLGPDSSLI